MNFELNGLYVMYGVLILMIAFTGYSLKKRWQSRESLLDFDDLLLEDDGKGSKQMSRAAAVFFGSFFLTSWMMIYMTIKGTMTEGYFSAYGLMWVAPIVAKIIWNKPITLQQAGNAVANADGSAKE